MGKIFFIGDSAATSHMTSNKMGVYNLVPINGSVMIGNGKSISCTHKGKLDVICKHKDGSIARETWDVKIVPELNHDLFSFTKAMKDGWQMNGRWKYGGLLIELFKTTRASMKFDRMIPSGSSWLMGIRVQRVFDQAHAAMEPGKTIFISKFHQITGVADDVRVEAGPSCKEVALDGIEECAGAGTKSSCMKPLDQFLLCLGSKKCVGVVLGLVGVERKAPKAVWETRSGENGLIVMVDGDSMFVEGDRAVVVA